MSCDTVNLDFLLLEQNVITNLQYADGAVEMGTHEVSEVELIVSRTHEHRTAFSESCNRLTTNVVVSHQTTAVGVTFQRLIKQLAIYLVHIYRYTQQLLIFLKEIHPSIDITSTVVTMNHSHQRTIRCGHHVNHLVRLRQFLFKDNHRE